MRHNSEALRGRRQRSSGAGRQLGQRPPGLAAIEHGLLSAEAASPVGPGPRVGLRWGS